MNNRILLIIFAVLLGVFLLTRAFQGGKTESFDPQLVELDTSTVTRIVLTPKAEEHEEVILLREDQGWSATRGSMSAGVPADKVETLLAGLTGIRAERVVTKAQDQWSQYEVDEQGSGVVVYAGDKVVADFVVGTFKFDQVQRSASSYVRLGSKDAVYVVDGFLSMQFNRGFNSFRNNAILSLQKDDLRQISLTYADGQVASIAKDDVDGRWYFAGMEAVDSTLMSQYLNGLTNVTSSEFYDAAAPPVDQLQQKIEFTGNNFIAPMVVECYASADTSKPFIIHSSANADNYFLSDSAGGYSRVFGKVNQLLEAL